MATKSTHLKVKGMHCTGCEETIENAVAHLPGVQKVNADHVKQTVDVEFDSELAGEGGIRRAIEEKSYEFESTSTRSSSHPVRNGLIFLFLLLIVGGVTFWGKSMIPGLVGEMSAHSVMPCYFPSDFLPVFTVLACVEVSWWAIRRPLSHALQAPRRWLI